MNSAAAKSGLSPKLSEAVKAALQPYVDRGVLAGAVTLVADKQSLLSLDTVGFADIAARKPMSPDAVFWVASQTKPITATALMMLVDEGKIRLDDPVAEYLPEFKDLWLAAEQDDQHILLKRPSQTMIVRHTLCHISGMPFSSPMEVPTLDQLPLRDAARSYAITPLRSEPGTKYAYSNAGTNTAGCIIETVSGMPYAKFLDERLFGPLGMKDTTFWPSAAQLSRLAKSYKPDSAKTALEEITIGQLFHPLSDRRRQPMPAGGLFSTAEDIMRFCQMTLSGGTLNGRRYLSERAVAEMTARQTPASLQESCGLGWFTGGGVFGHGGAYSTNMSIDSNRGLITVFLVQHNGFPADGDKAYAAFKAAAESFADGAAR